MKPTPTRTLNPLPFQDLEPHRFEDLIRQLAYDLREWRSLEAVGRSGGDDGIDIRAFEVVRGPVTDDETEDAVPATGERLWVFQCKRERTLSAQRVRTVVQDSLRSLADPPYGFVLAVSGDVSKRARDAFRAEMVSRGIEEFHVWARSELEDMLFQPKNDRLLFAYFGISLQPRRRSIATTIRSKLAIKKQLEKLAEGAHGDDILVLLRDPTDDRYPVRPDPDKPEPRWFPCHITTVKNPYGIVVRRREYLAALTPDRHGWDYLPQADLEASHVKGMLQAEGIDLDEGWTSSSFVDTCR